MKSVKVCSFLPAATTMMYHMGLDGLLEAVTFECPSDKPKVVRSYIEGQQYTSAEISQIVAESKQIGKELYYVDEQLLQEIAPDVIFTQDVCNVCQIGTSYAERAVYRLDKKPLVISLTPRNLDDVYENAITIGRAVNREEAAYRLLGELKRRTDRIMDTLRLHNAPLKKVMFLEWLDPIYNCGHWIPYQVAQAGGVDMLSNPSGYSVVTSWERILLYDPEVLVVAPCGFTSARAAAEMNRLTARKGWYDLSAVRNNAVYLADADLFTCPSTYLVDGIELLASLFHPQLFPLPAYLYNKCFQYAAASAIKSIP